MVKSFLGKFQFWNLGGVLAFLKLFGQFFRLDCWEKIEHCLNLEGLSLLGFSIDLVYILHQGKIFITSSPSLKRCNWAKRTKRVVRKLAALTEIWRKRTSLLVFLLFKLLVFEFSFSVSDKIDAFLQEVIEGRISCVLFKIIYRYFINIFILILLIFHNFLNFLTIFDFFDLKFLISLQIPSLFIRLLLNFHVLYFFQHYRILNFSKLNFFWNSFLCEINFWNCWKIC